jgi:aryl-alcohol dehydrogenase-like predicted oxidoreductase
MEFKNLGSTGLKVSSVGIGCNNFGRRCNLELTNEVVNAALDCGINFFDTADVYGPRGLSEEYLGKAIAGKRDDLVIATKFGMTMDDSGFKKGASRRYIMQTVEDSLRRLNTDYIDLYQQHFPDPQTPIEETLRALDDLVHQGKVRYLGCSNFSGWQVSDADWTARDLNLNRFVTAQNLYSLIDRSIEKEVMPACEQYGLGILPYFPLASGLLTGKYTRGSEPPEGSRLSSWGDRKKSALSDDNFDLIEKLTSFAEERGHSILDLAMSWLASMPSIPSVIAGATSKAQVQQNAEAASWQLTMEEMREVNEISAR